MIVYAYIHQDNCIHSHTFGAFELPNTVSFFSHMCWLGPEVSDASLLLSKWASASLPFARLQRKCFSRHESAHGLWLCSSRQMRWLCWLFLGWETAFSFQAVAWRAVYGWDSPQQIAVCGSLPVLTAHSFARYGECTLTPLIPSPSGQHLMSISLEATLEISCAQTQIL